MANSCFKIPYPVNEPVRSYTPNSTEKEAVLETYRKLYGQTKEVPLRIHGKDITTGDLGTMHPPHDHKHQLGVYHKARPEDIKLAIDSALAARAQWSTMDWSARASIFLKAAALVAGPYRDIINASTMLAQSKTIHQAEIDAACEFADFLRFNAYYLQEIYEQQPDSDDGIWNRLSYRPLEGFVYAVSPFNFTAIAGNLPASAALMGNVVIWKPSDHQVFSAQVVMEIFEEAGVPPGVINMVMGDPEMITNIVLDTPEFAGIHYTGSTAVFKDIWTKIGSKIHQFKSYPRIVGETGGKDFIIAHPSAKPLEVAAAIIRGGFEYQGQKCSAASRVYLPASIAPQILEHTQKMMAEIQMGSPEDFENFVTAVIHQGAFNRLKDAIESIRKSDEATILAGGNCDDSKGYFVEPTLVQTTNPHFFSMETELFGPLITVYVYEDKDWKETLELIDRTSEYALTGAVFSQDRYALEEALGALENSAGNFYLNDKCTGAVVGQQPFGGARGSGTNDKAGSVYNLLRWVSPRLIKETFVPAQDFKYPFLG